jgi:hypothetical protein
LPQIFNASRALIDTGPAALRSNMYTLASMVQKYPIEQNPKQMAIVEEIKEFLLDVVPKTAFSNALEELVS